MFKLSKYLLQIDSEGGLEAKDVLLYSTRSKQTCILRKELLHLLGEGSTELLPESLFRQFIKKEIITSEYDDELVTVHQRNLQKNVLSIVGDDQTLLDAQKIIQKTQDWMERQKWNEVFLIWDYSTSSPVFDLSLIEKLHDLDVKQTFLLSLDESLVIPEHTLYSAQSRVFVQDAEFQHTALQQLIENLSGLKTFDVIYFLADQHNLNLIIDQFLDELVNVKSRIRFCITDFINRTERRKESLDPYGEGFRKLIKEKRVSLNQPFSSSVSNFSLGYLRELNQGSVFVSLEDQQLDVLEKGLSRLNPKCQSCNFLPVCGGEYQNGENVICPTYKQFYQPHLKMLNRQRSGL